MTTQSLPGTVQQVQGTRNIPIGLLLLLLASFILPLWGLIHTVDYIAGQMVHKGWLEAVGAHNRAGFNFQCLMNSACNTAVQKAVPHFFPLWTWVGPAVGFIVYALGSKPKTYSVRDPGTVWWAQRDDGGIQQYTGNDPKRKENVMQGYLGHLLTVEKTGEIDYKKTIPLYVRMAALSENVLILGGVGAGKTRGYFRPLLMLAAVLGFTVIVFDLKYPQPDSGFYDMVGFWKKAGRRVMMFTPFSDNTMRLPILESVEDYASALSMSSTIMPPPEYGPEPGKHYRDRDRGVLAAFILYVARSDNPSLAELLTIAQYTPQEMKEWFERQMEIDPDSEIVQNLKGVFGQGDKEVASVLQGIKNALRIFYNPKVARATTSKEGENMNIRAAFRTPTLIYVGIQQEYMMEGDGVVLLQLVKRYIDKQLQREAEFQGGSLRKHVGYIMDEFPSFGQLPYMMRSLGVLRSYNVSHHIGVQNLKQLAVVYGDNYSDALTTNVIGRKIFYPLAVEGDEKRVFSEALGMTTVYDIGEGDSRRAFLGSNIDDTTRQTVSYRKVAIPLLPPEQFAHFRPMEAIVMGRGSNPMRVFMPAIEDKEMYIEDPNHPSGLKGLPNYLAQFYEKVNPERENMAKYTQELVASGVLGTSIKQTRSDAHEHGVSIVSLNREEMGQAFDSWMSQVLDSRPRVRLAGEEKDRLYLKISGLPSDLTKEVTLQGHYARGWTAKYGQEEVRVTKSGLENLQPETRERLEREAVFGAVLFWMEQNPTLIEGTPERDELPENERPEVQAYLKDSVLSLGLTPFKNLFGPVIPKTRRIDTRNYVDIDLNKPMEFIAEIKALREAAQSNSDAQASADPLAPAGDGVGVEEARRDVPQEGGGAGVGELTVFTEEEKRPVTPFLMGGAKPMKVRGWQDAEVEETVLRSREVLELPEEEEFGIEEE